MSFPHRNSIYMPDSTEVSPFTKQDRVWDQLIGEERKEKIAWRLVAVCSLTLMLASIGGWIYAIRLPKTVPMVIEIAPWGEAKYVGDISQYSYQGVHVPETAIQYQLRDFISKLRGISRDSEVLYQNITECYTKVTSGCADKMTGELRKNDPFSEVGKIKRTVTIESILKVTSTTWQVDWIEQSAGDSSRRERIRGIFTVTLLEPPEKQRIQNPLGIYIADYDMTVLTEGDMK